MYNDRKPVATDAARVETIRQFAAPADDVTGRLQQEVGTVERSERRTSPAAAPSARPQDDAPPSDPSDRRPKRRYRRVVIDDGTALTAKKPPELLAVQFPERRPNRR